MQSLVYTLYGEEMWEGVKLILGEVYKLLICLLTYCFSFQCSGNLTQFEWKIKDQCVETWLFLSASFLLQCKNMLMLYPGRKIQFLSSLVRGVTAVFLLLLHGISRGLLKVYFWVCLQESLIKSTIWSGWSQTLARFSSVVDLSEDLFCFKWFAKLLTGFSPFSQYLWLRMLIQV